MKIIILQILTLFIIFDVIQAQHPSLDPNYNLIFEENFDIFDKHVWEIYPNDVNNFLTPPYSNHTRPDEPYVITDRPENVYVSEGVLHQVFRKESYMGKEFTTSSIQSKGLFGPNIYVEARVKLPYQNPNLIQDRIKQSAFWMYKGGPCLMSTYYGYREIDILEYQGNTPHTYNNLNGSLNNYGASTGNLHYCGYDNCTSTTPLNYNGYINPYSTDPCRVLQEYNYIIPNQGAWHTASTYWERENVSLLLDGLWHNTRNTTTPFNQYNAMQRNMRIINSIDVNPRAKEDKKDKQTLLERFNSSKGLFPFEYQTDYIKVWSLKKDCETVVFDIPNFNTYHFALKKSIILGEQTVVPITSNIISLRATDYIEFIEGFEVFDNREISFNTNECPN